MLSSSPLPSDSTAERIRLDKLSSLKHYSVPAQPGALSAHPIAPSTVPSMLYGSVLSTRSPLAILATVHLERDRFRELNFKFLSFESAPPPSAPIVGGYSLRVSTYLFPLPG